MQPSVKISLILLIEGNFQAAKYCFEKLGIKIQTKEKLFNEEQDGFINAIDGIEVELLVADIAKDYPAYTSYQKQYFYPIADHFITCESRGKAYNDLLKKTTGTHVCILHPSIIIPEGAISELLVHSQMIKKCGLVCLANTVENKWMTPLNDHDDNFVNVFVDDDDNVDGVCLFDREYLNYVGGMMDGLHGQELNHYAKRCTSLNLQNFYITNKFGIDILGIENPNKISGLEKLDLSLEEMAHRKNWYIELV